MSYLENTTKCEVSPVELQLTRLLAIFIYFSIIGGGGFEAEYLLFGELYEVSTS